jgi:hypothetical protein
MNRIEGFITNTFACREAFAAHPAGIHLVGDQRHDLYLNIRFAFLLQNFAHQFTGPRGDAVGASRFDIGCRDPGDLHVNDLLGCLD